MLAHSKHLSPTIFIKLQKFKRNCIQFQNCSTTPGNKYYGQTNHIECFLIYYTNKERKMQLGYNLILKHLIIQLFKRDLNSLKNKN